LVINGSEGISSGFAQKILPRNPKEVQKYIEYYLKNPDAPRKGFNNSPYFKGFKGKIHKGDEKNQYIIEGVFERKGNKVIITELPIGYSLKSYIKVLDKLEDDKKITKYEDYSEDNFHFVVHFNRKYLDSLSDDKLYDLLKLRKKVTENFTVITEKNTIQQYDNVTDVIWHYIEVKKEYLKKRKDHMIKTLTENIKYDVSRYVFVSKIVDGSLVISRRPTKDIIDDLEKTEKIIKKDDSFDYLLNMSISSITEEKMNQLLAKIKKQKDELDAIKRKTIEEIWLDDLKSIKF
jgi:DNA topoisomerase-2